MSDNWKVLEKELTDIFADGPVPFVRAHLLFDAESAHSTEVMQFRGYLILSDAFKCFVIETFEHFDRRFGRPDVPPPEKNSQYSFQVVRLISCFRSLCGAERLAINGYPFEAFTILRNTFDNLILISATNQNIADFLEVEGIQSEESYDPALARKLRKKTERKIRQKMLGSDSGLSEATQFELIRLNDLFDFETHGARLSMGAAIGWMKGEEPLNILPEFKAERFALFLNRYNEISWMLLRCLPMIQYAQLRLPAEWASKWLVLDRAFNVHVAALTAQLGKPVGAAVVDFVTQKFPFQVDSQFQQSR